MAEEQRLKDELVVATCKHDFNAPSILSLTSHVHITDVSLVTRLA